MENSSAPPDSFFVVGHPSDDPLPQQQQQQHQPPSSSYDHRRRSSSFATTATLPQQPQQQPTRSRFSVSPAEPPRVVGVNNQHTSSNMINTKQQWSWLYPRHQPGVDDKPLPSHVLAGLTTAGVASTLLTTLFAHMIGTITATTTIAYQTTTTNETSTDPVRTKDSGW